MDPEELLKGIKVEAEHMGTYEWLQRCFRDGMCPSPNMLFTHIALDHLNEKADYYCQLEKAGL